METKPYIPFYRKPINWVVLVAVTVAGMAFTMAYLEHDRTKRLNETRQSSAAFIRQKQMEWEKEKSAILSELQPSLK